MQEQERVCFTERSILLSCGIAQGLAVVGARLENTDMAAQVLEGFAVKLTNAAFSLTPAIQIL